MKLLSYGITAMGFCIGSNSDMIDYQKNRYPIKAFSSDNLTNSIEKVLNKQ